MAGMATPRVFKPPARRLIDAAERLFGESGVERVSLEQIAAAADQANKYAVQYHFGSREGLISAIFEMRLPSIDARRRAYLDALKASGELSVRELLWVFIRPVIEEVDAEGKHRFASFSARLFHLPKLRAYWFNSPYVSSAMEVFALLRSQTPQLSKADFDIRCMLMIEIFYAAMRRIDDPVTTNDAFGVRVADGAQLLANAVEACAAALTAPPAAKSLDGIDVIRTSAQVRPKRSAAKTPTARSAQRKKVLAKRARTAP